MFITYAHVRRYVDVRKGVSDEKQQRIKAEEGSILYFDVLSSTS